MKLVGRNAVTLVCLLAATLGFRAQAQQSGDGSGTNSKPAASSSPADSQDPSRVKTQTNSNPFPDDTTSVPVMPSRDVPDLPPSSGTAEKPSIPLPPDDGDPVKSPEDANAANAKDSSSSSSLSGIDALLPGTDDTPQPGKGNKKGAPPVAEHRETAKEDENVGSYYLDNKNWKAALSRFQSALVLDPDNPDVYWGLGESERHLGDLAGARVDYQRVVDYDPDSRHGKEAKKLLENPEIANAKAASAAPIEAKPSQ